MRTFRNIFIGGLSFLAVLSSSVVNGQEKPADSNQYHIVPETVMTGFCEQDAEGNTEAVFLDIHNGITFWRNYSPETADSKASPLMHEHYAAQLSSLTFTFKQHILDRETRMLPGILKFKDMSQDVILDIDMAESIKKSADNGEVQLVATLSLRPASPSNVSTESRQDGGLNFCVAMQARTEKASENYAMEQMMFTTR